MTDKYIIDLIKKRFGDKSIADIPLFRGGGSFRAELATSGISVDNLSTQPFLPWEIFTEVVALIRAKGGIVSKGNAMNSKLGEGGLPLDSIEGHIACTIYRKKIGDSVFRRVTPIACILVWAGICKNRPGELELIT